MSQIPQAPTGPRIQLIDVLRGVALVAMTLYHFVWDLEYFGWVLPATISLPGWVTFARCIASSFLFLTGVSLFLAHKNGIKWQGFWKREAMIIAAALAVTVATRLIFPSGFIFFGILHAIALFSLLGLPFLRLPWIVSVATGVVILWIGLNYSDPLFNSPALWWVGLSSPPPISNDYVPFFPWFAAPLFGIAAAKLANAVGLREKLNSISLPRWLANPLTFLGQHSLAYYLLHQPALIALVWLFTTVAGPPDRTPNFIHACTIQCTAQRDAQFCKSYCGCVADELKKADLFTSFNEGKVDLTKDQTAQDIISQCSFNSDSMNSDG